MFTFSSMQHINQTILQMFRMYCSYAKLACSLSPALFSKLGLTHVKHTSKGGQDIRSVSSNSYFMEQSFLSACLLLSSIKISDDPTMNPNFVKCVDATCGALHWPLKPS